MEKHKYPVGTKFLFKDEVWGEVKEVEVNNFGDKIYRVLWKDGPATTGEDDKTVIRDMTKIIYPHGYQTPLWRVLNGE